MATKPFVVAAIRRPVSLPGGAPAAFGDPPVELDPEDPRVQRAVRSGDIAPAPTPAKPAKKDD
jgi:hypothetical protein